MTLHMDTITFTSTCSCNRRHSSQWVWDLSEIMFQPKTKERFMDFVLEKGHLIAIMSSNEIKEHQMHNSYSNTTLDNQDKQRFSGFSIKLC